MKRNLRDRDLWIFGKCGIPTRERMNTAVFDLDQAMLVSHGFSVLPKHIPTAWGFALRAKT